MNIQRAPRLAVLTQLVEHFRAWRDWEIDEWFFTVFVLGALVILAIGIPAWIADTNAFYEACLKDHKRYECDVLYRQAHPPTPSTTVYVR